MDMAMINKVLSTVRGFGSNIYYFVKRNFIIYNDRSRFRIFIFRKKLLSIGKNNNLYTKIFCKNRNYVLNERNISIKIDGCKKILFVVEGLSLNGGMENRMFQYATRLKQEGLVTIFLTEYNNYTPIVEKFINFHLHFYDANFQECLSSLVKSQQIDIVEFHFGGMKYFKNIDIVSLKKICRIGVTIHNYLNLPLEKFSHFDYKITSYDTNLKFIPNGVFTQKRQWKYLSQKEALLISRFSKEKLPTIESFVDFCAENKINPYLAGPLSDSESRIIKENLVLKYNLNKSHFLGNINTIPFLRGNLHKYLFVGGVGQVVIEALSMGIPALVCSHAGVHYSSFVNKNNFDKLHKNNFVINRIAGKINIFQELPDENYEYLPEYLLEKISFENSFSIYKEKIKI